MKITIWRCRDCAYWRREEGSRLHVASYIGDDGFNYSADHELEPVEYIPNVCFSCTGTGFATTDPEDASACLDCGGTGKLDRT